jgi:ORF6N domain
MKKSLVRVPHTSVENAILIIRSERVILDTDWAGLYGVGNRALIQSVKRNIRRFPPDFLFQLTKSEFDSLRSQIVISKGHGGRRSLPYAFTEHGAIRGHKSAE